MLKKLLFLIVIVFVAILPLFCQSFQVQCLDKTNNSPIVGGVVQVNDSLYFETDTLGQTLVSGVNFPLKITITSLGYEMMQLTEKESFTNKIYYLSPNNTFLSTVTISSSKYEKALNEVVSSLEIMKPQTLATINAKALDDALERVPGVTMIDGQANIRGGSGFSYGAGSRVLLLIDGIPALQSDAGTPNWADIPIENIAQIEILKGAASTLYGSSALNGVVNVLTSYPSETPESNLVVQSTLFDKPKDKNYDPLNYTPYEANIILNHKRKINKFDVLGSLAYFDNKSFNDSTFLRQFRLTLGSRYRIKDNLSANINFTLNTGESSEFFFWKNETTGKYSSAPNTISSSKKLRFFVDPSVTYFDKSKGQHKFLSRLFFVNNDNNANRSNKSNLFYSEYQYVKHLSDKKATLSAGIVYTGTSVDAKIYGDAVYTSYNTGIYAQYEQKFFEKLILTGGVRWEHNLQKSPEIVGNDTIPHGKTSESKPVYRCGLNYKLMPYTFLRASWGQGYRYPTIAEKFVKTNFGATSISPNGKLQSETGYSTEIGIKQGMKMGSWSGMIDLAYFYSEYQNMMEFTFVDLITGFQSINIGDTKISGIDFSIMGKMNFNKLEIKQFFSFTHIDPKFKEFTAAIDNGSSADYNVLKYRFRNNTKFDIEFGYNRWVIGCLGSIYSPMEAIDKVFEIFVSGLQKYRQEHNRSITVIDFRLGYQFKSKIDLTLYAKNLFNLEYSIRPGLMDAPRNFGLRAAYKF